jgi:hypothetical protein
MPNFHSNFDYDVFLSHSPEDHAVVRDVAERLHKDGVKVWLDEWELVPGGVIAAQIEEGLERSRVLALCMSANAFESQLENQAVTFLAPANQERRFLPLRLDDAPIPSSLARFVYIDWRPANREQEYAKLLEACRQPVTRPLEASQTSIKSRRRFRVSFSFSSEIRNFIGEVAKILAERFGEQAILYDRFHEAEFARSDLAFYVPHLFAEETELIVYVSGEDDDRKDWVGLESSSINSLIKKRQSDKILFCTFGKTWILGMFPTVDFLDLNRKTPEELATLILERLALIEGYNKDYYTRAPPRSPKEQKKVPSRRKSTTKGEESVEHALVAGPAGFHSEFRAIGVDGNIVDYLEVEAEAVRLAELIALRETNLPLAVGLFGNWGTGKSHFMGLLRMHMLDRANTARATDGSADGRWCKEIVPIVFNAWHYLDSNLWASLVSEIFERLFDRYSRCRKNCEKWTGLWLAPKRTSC